MKEEYVKLLEEFKAWLIKNDYSKSHIDTAMTAVKQFIVYSEKNNVDIYNIDNKETDTYKSHLENHINIKTVKRYIGNVRLFFHYLIEEGKSKENSFSQVGGKYNFGDENKLILSEYKVWLKNTYPVKKGCGKYYSARHFLKYSQENRNNVLYATLNTIDKYRMCTAPLKL